MRLKKFLFLCIFIFIFSATIFPNITDYLEDFGKCYSEEDRSSDYPASLMNDDISWEWSSWMSDETEDNKLYRWIKADLKEIRTINYFAIHWVDDKYATKFNIHYSKDHLDWITQGNDILKPEGLTEMRDIIVEYDNFGEIEARYIWIELKEKNSNVYQINTLCIGYQN